MAKKTLKKTLLRRSSVLILAAALSLHLGSNFVAPSRAEALTVISDIDDTIKITRVNTINAIFSGLLDTSIFIGMNQVVMLMKNESSKNRLILISGSPSLVSGPIDRMLEENRIEPDEVHLMGGSDNKLEEILRVVRDTDDDFVLIGDDQESDPQFYETAKKRFPDKVKAIYIHQVNAKKLPAGQRGYYSAYEIALWESSEGRLNAQAPAAVLSAIENELKLGSNDAFIGQRISEDLVPTWQKCFKPRKDNVLAEPKRLAALQPAAKIHLEYLAKLQSIVSRNCEK